jgi:dTMP kinase
LGRGPHRFARLDRIEAQGLAFHERVRAGYLAHARTSPERIKVVRADQSIEEIQHEIRELLQTLLAGRQQASKLAR